MCAIQIQATVLVFRLEFSQAGADFLMYALAGGAQVKKVEEDGVWLQCKDQSDLQKLTAGTTLWATGIKMNPLSTAIAGAMPDGQQVCKSCLSCGLSPYNAGHTTRLHVIGQCWT